MEPYMNSSCVRLKLSATMRLVLFALSMLISFLHGTTVPADERATADTAKSSGRRIAVIIVGHPGDNEHVEMFRSAVAKIRNGMVEHYGFRAEDIHVFTGDGEEEDAATVAEQTAERNADGTTGAESALPSDDVLDSTAAGPPAKPATRESIATELQPLKPTVRADDSLYVIAMGHTHFEAGLAWFNLHGPDVQQTQFAEFFQGFKAKEQVFFVTIPCSGYYIRTLSGPGRYIITATETDLEVNETLSPHALADLFSADPDVKWDLNSDKQLSLLEFYIALCQGVADLYSDETLIATEHGLLDDNGDGRGSELQQHYLSEDQGGLPKNRQRRILTEGRDGAAASRLQLLDL